MGRGASGLPSRRRWPAHSYACSMKKDRLDQICPRGHAAHASKERSWIMKIKHSTILFAALTAFGLFLGITYWTPCVDLVRKILDAASPIFLGFVLAYVVNIPMTFYERHYFPRSGNALARASARPVCMLAAFLTVILILAAVIGLVLPELLSCIRLMLEEVPKILEKLIPLLPEENALSEELAQRLRNIDWAQVLYNLLQGLLSGLGNVATVTANVAGYLVDFLLALIFSLYLLAGKEKLQAQLARLLSTYLRPSWNRNLHHVAGVLNNCFHRYIVGQCTEAVILGTLCALGMMLLGFPYAAMTGVVVGVSALIPVMGAYIGGAVGFLLILTVDPMKALLFVVYLVILQQLEGNLIYPRVVGSSIGLPGVWVLAAVTIGGGVFGILGMLLGVPLAAAAYQLLGEHSRRQTPPAETT